MRLRDRRIFLLPQRGQFFEKRIAIPLSRDPSPRILKYSGKVETCLKNA